MTEKRQEVTKRSNVNARNLLQNRQYSWSVFLFRRSIWVSLELVHRRSQNFTIIDREKHTIEQHFTWNQVTVKINLRHQYGISVAEEQTSLLVARRGRDGRFCRLHMVRNCLLFSVLQEKTEEKTTPTNEHWRGIFGEIIHHFRTLAELTFWDCYKGQGKNSPRSIYYNFNMTPRL